MKRSWTGLCRGISALLDVRLRGQHSVRRHAGDDYWVTESYGHGERQADNPDEAGARTRWTPVSALVVDDFDDVLIPASRTRSKTR